MITQFSPSLCNLSHLGSNVFSFMFATHSLCSRYAPTTRVVPSGCSLGPLSRLVHVGYSVHLISCCCMKVTPYGRHQLRFIPVPLLLRDFHTRVYSLNSACLGRTL